MSNFGVGNAFTSGVSSSGGGGLFGGGGLSGSLLSRSCKVSSFFSLIKSTICPSFIALISRSPGKINKYINIKRRKAEEIPPVK